MARTWKGTIMVEGSPTGDGRLIHDGALTWPDLPLPLKWQKADIMGHDGSIVVATIETLTRNGQLIEGTGTFLEPEPGTDLADSINEVQLLVESKAVGLSAELDDVVDQITETERADGGLDLMFEVESGRVRAAAIVSTPAFVECTIEMTGDTADALPAEDPALAPVAAAGSCCDECAADGGSCATTDDYAPTDAMRQEAARFLEWHRAGNRGGTAAAIVRARAIAAGEAAEYGDLRRALSYFQRHAADRNGAGWREGEPGYPSPERVAWAAWGGDAGYAAARHAVTEREGVAAVGTFEAVTAAAGAQRLPRAEWFRDPGLSEPTPMTITDEGRVYGHLAPWNSCHMSVQDQCLTPPRTQTDYAYFHQGGGLTVRDATGKRSTIQVGHITMGTGHADVRLSRVPAAEHYDNTGAVAADVCAGEDEHGIWIAGAVRSDLSPERLHALKASALSGDWRYVQGLGLELVASLAVNTPGFPIVRSRVASGHPMALVAGAVIEADKDHSHLRRTHPSAHRPARRHDARLLPAVDALAATIGRDTRSLVAALADDVHGGK